MKTETAPSNLETISLPNAKFTVVTQALPERHKDFWQLFRENWEKENRKALSDFIDSDTVVIDLGAWVGPMTLYSAALGAKHVYAFEPDGVAQKFLKANYAANIELQDKITLFESAIAKTDGEIGIGPLSGRPMGDSTTSTEGTNLTYVPSMSVDTMLEKCQFDSARKICIKIDVEGSEKYILQDIVDRLAATSKPFLILIEVHAYHFNTEDSNRVEKALDQLISLSDKFAYTQRRRIGEAQTYPDLEIEWKTELYHSAGLFDMTFERK
jgi:FkbM family methyltransferase